MNEITTPQQSRRPLWPILLAFIGMSLGILANGPDSVLRIFLLLATILAFIDIMDGFRAAPQNWLAHGLAAYYQLLLSFTGVALVMWQSSIQFWENAPKYIALTLLFGLMVGTFFAIKERGRPENLLQGIHNPRSLFGSLLLLQIIAQVFIYLKPEASIAQVGAVIILLGFFAQPFAPSKPLPLVPFLTLKRLSFGITLLVLLADGLLR